MKSHSAIGQGKYLRAKYLGNGALALSFCALIFAFVVGILIVSLTISLYPWQRPRDYYYYYEGNDYGCWYDYDFDGSGELPIMLQVNVSFTSLPKQSLIINLTISMYVPLYLSISCYQCYCVNDY